MHDGDSAPSCCAFTHWVAYEEVSNLNIHQNLQESFLKHSSLEHTHTHTHTVHSFYLTRSSMGLETSIFIKPQVMQMLLVLGPCSETH